MTTSMKLHSADCRFGLTQFEKPSIILCQFTGDGSLTMIWIRDGIRRIQEIDAVIFDVDGVLIDDQVSYYATVKATVEHVVSKIRGHPSQNGAVTDADILAFKVAGGFNDDWLLSYTLSGIILAADRAPLRPLPQIARESAGRGMPWVRAAYFPSLDLELAQVERICNEYYWGADLLQDRLGLEPAFHTGAGFVSLEQPLVPVGFFDEVKAVHVRRFGIITGRSPVELQAGLHTLRKVVGPGVHFDVMITSSHIRKPDPRALVEAARAIETKSALYIGDTGDDLQLVLNYRSAGTSAISCLAAIVAKPGLAEHFAHAGADIVLDRTTELPAAITSVLDRAADMNSAPSEAPCHR